MAEFLLELLCEEIPARMQDRAAADLARLVCQALDAARLGYGRERHFATPRRLALIIDDIEREQATQIVERRGPRQDAPERARDGFLRGLQGQPYVLDEVVDKKGTFLLARIEQPGRPTGEILAAELPLLLAEFPWPKSMRWSDGDAKWVRPLLSICCLFDGQTVPFSFAGIASGRQSTGHRFMAPTPFEVGDAQDYLAALGERSVIVDGDERRRRIESGARANAASVGLKIRPDARLLDELKGLVEWPVPLLGSIDRRFMELPDEVLITSMREHQRYLAVVDEQDRLAPHFVAVANIAATDGGKAVIAGNERVLRARLWDARYFWDNDRRTPLIDRLPALDRMVFHAKLGTVGEKVARIERLAAQLADWLPDADRSEVATAARLAKADLVTGMVGEFPELQGIMGGYYARAEQLGDGIALAISEHYRPQGPSDACPTSLSGTIVALADKIDTLTGFFAADIRPTGSGDPFALRRAALGILRLILENRLRLDSQALFAAALSGYGAKFGDCDASQLIAALRNFLLERLEVQQRDAGIRFDLIRAVADHSPDGDFVRLVARVAALQDLLQGEHGGDLMAGYRRAERILMIEERKRADDDPITATYSSELLTEPAEKALGDELARATLELRSLLAAESFVAAMQRLGRLRPYIDDFFDHVMVNVDNQRLRDNRLSLLAAVRRGFSEIADFSRVED